jgi:hypothetical protein
MLVHPVPCDRKQLRSQAGPFLLASRVRAYIVSAILMTIKKLSFSRFENGVTGGLRLGGFFQFHALTVVLDRSTFKLIDTGLAQVVGNQ